MPIPELTIDEFLPKGSRECTLTEVMSRFSRSIESDRRPDLARELVAYSDERHSANVGQFLVVDGSFVTGKARPGDIDLRLVLRDEST